MSDETTSGHEAACACTHSVPWRSDGTGYRCGACGVLVAFPARVWTVETPWMKVNGQAPDPLDTKYDGVTLRVLLVAEGLQRHDQGDRVPLSRQPLTPIQRAAVSAHWSAQLRAKVEASKERARMTVMVDVDVEDEPW